MARPGILYTHVAAAAEALLAQGRNPTVDTVREALGGTGSKSTIAPMLKRWKEAHHGALPRGADVGLPPALLQAMKNVYDNLQAEVRQQLEEVTLSHAASLLAAEQENHRLREEGAALSAEFAALTTSMGQAEQAMALVQAEIQSQHVQLAALQSENAGLHVRLADRASEIGALNQQLTQSRAQFDHYQEAIALQRAQERQAGEERVARLDHELITLRRQWALEQASGAQQAVQLTQIAQDKARLSDALQATQRELIQSRAEREQLACQVGELTQLRDALQSGHEALQRHVADTRTALAVSARELVLLRERLERTENTMEGLAQEKLRLLQEHSALQADMRQQRALQEADAASMPPAAD